MASAEPRHDLLIRAYSFRRVFRWNLVFRPFRQALCLNLNARISKYTNSNASIEGCRLPDQIVDWENCRLVTVSGGSEDYTLQKLVETISGIFSRRHVG